MPVDARPTVAAPDDDPYLWLEEIEGARALAWVAAQNNATLATFGNATFASDRDTLAALLDRPDHIPFVVRRGQHLYNFWRDANNPRGLWRRTTLDSFRTEQPAGRSCSMSTRWWRRRRRTGSGRRFDAAGHA